MAPVRRYLRITKYSVLECRIYLDNPSLAQSWLLNPRNPVLPRVIESIRPLVLPKLLEEKERGKKKSSKKKQIKDVIVKDDFEVSMFLTETSTRHSLLTKRKHFREKLPGMMTSNSSKLIAETNETPFDVDSETVAAPVRVEEESDDEGVQLSAIPMATSTRRRRRHRPGAGALEDEADENSDHSAIEIDSDDEQPSSKRTGRGRVNALDKDDDEDEDDKKKLAMDISYEGFAIYGRVLCLVVKRREQKTVGGTDGNNPSGQAKMENWITSTQIPVGEEA